MLFITEQIESKRDGFKSLTKNIDTTTSAGKMIMQMVGVSAEFERNMLTERTRKEFDYANEQPRDCGRRQKLKISKVRKLSNLIEK